MKLPSISRNKFEKPQSASSQRPPKGVNIGNLEKNLLMKLNQYDESHNIKYSDSLKLSANFNNDPLDNFLFEESSPIQEVRSNQKQISFKSALEEQEPRARLSTDVKKLKPILLKKTESGQQQPPSQSRGPTKPGAKQVSAQQDLFLTGAEQGDTKNQDESDDSSDEVIRISERQKERDQVRKVMSYPEDEEFSSMHEMLHRSIGEKLKQLDSPKRFQRDVRRHKWPQENYN